MLGYMTTIYNWLKSWFITTDTRIITKKKYIKFKMKQVTPKYNVRWNPNEEIYLI